MAGRRPLPTALKLIQGNPGKRPINKDEPKPEIKAPTCPPHLSRPAKNEWKRIVPILTNLGIMTKVDRAAIAAYCQSYGRWVEAENKVQERGDVVKTTNGNIVTNPYLSVANRAMDNMRKFLVEFGMTPSSRSRISADKKESSSEYDNL